METNDKTNNTNKGNIIKNSNWQEVEQLVFLCLNNTQIVPSLKAELLNSAINFAIVIQCTRYIKSFYNNYASLIPFYRNHAPLTFI